MSAFSLHIKWRGKQEYTVQYYGIAFLESQFVFVSQSVKHFHFFSETEKWEDYSKE